jgi:hypothetical protein
LFTFAESVGAEQQQDVRAHHGDRKHFQMKVDVVVVEVGYADKKSMPVTRLHANAAIAYGTKR